MAAIPSDIETDTQPPMTIPLRHFVVGFGFLLVGAALGVWTALGTGGGFAGVAQLHLLLVGWVCVTIMGAMTQFVPVWSGVPLHSRRLAAAQLVFVAVGLVGLVAAFLSNVWWLFVPAGLALVAGLWTFVYNIARTLARLDSHDVTERHFVLALGFFALLAPLGLLLAVGLYQPLGTMLPVSRPDIVEAHATVAVFGAVLTTVIGALYQLGTMFTQTELHGIDIPLQRAETVAYPIGVLLLAGGRLVDLRIAAIVGGVLVTASLLVVAGILARRLAETQVDWTPMLTRYAVFVAGLALWSALTLPAWLGDPLGRSVVLGADGTEFLLVLGGIGFVVFGTLYHIVPFIVWVHRYSDLLGFEPVPMIDDLYDGRIAAVDSSLLVAGVVGLVLAELADLAWLTLPGASLFAGGSLLFVANMVLVLYRHSPRSLRDVVGLPAKTEP
ncbi:hypothetical protein [Salinibaculum salinum]|uniref:hypothetical protein n=1 Tax=Salinibaculum salinum TaxID=3131996 RepID=UPI0030EF6C8C